MRIWRNTRSTADLSTATFGVGFCEKGNERLSPQNGDNRLQACLLTPLEGDGSQSVRTPRHERRTAENSPYSGPATWVTALRGNEHTEDSLCGAFRINNS